jgi:hypothetical protein
MTGWAITRAIPLRFDPTRANGLTAAFELRVREREGRQPLRFTLQIGDGECHVRRGASGDAAAVATMGLADLIRLSSGLVGWPRLMSSGRLELSGDPFLALRFPSLFRLPAVPRITRPQMSLRRTTY